MLKKEYKLYKYQQDIINWMNKITKKKLYGSEGGVLFVDMGLGKTFTTLEYLRQNKIKKALIVCSKTLIQEWIQQIDKFYDIKPKVIILHSNYCKLKKITKEEIEKHDIVITTYHMLSRANKLSKEEKISDKYIYTEESYRGGRKQWVIEKNNKKFVKDNLNGIHSIYNIHWDTFIVDECQTLTNWKTSFFKSSYSIITDTIFGLSGTPIKNNRNELITLLKLLKINLFDIPSRWSKEEIPKSVYNLFYNVDYKKANKKLPIEKEIKIELDLIPRDFNIYKKYSEKMESLIGMMDKDKYGDNKYMALLGLFTRLRQICLDPYLLHQTEDGLNQYNEIMHNNNKNIKQNLTFNNKKFDKIKVILNDILKRKEKVIIFSSFTSYLKLLVKNLNLKTTMIHSEYSIKERMRKINDWKTNDNNNILIMNYRIGAEGLNLTEANNIILLDTWWNFALEKQAIGRIKRISQNKDINIYRLIYKNTIETLLLEKCIFKKDLFNKLKNDSELNDMKSKLSLNNLLGLIKEHKKIPKNDINIITNGINNISL